MEAIINKHEIRVLGLRRTGNHAIISWILDRQMGSSVHLNDILLQKGLDPYVTLRNRITVCNLPYYRCHDSWTLRRWKSLVKSILGIPESFALQTKDPQVSVDYVRQAKKEYFIYSYEDIYPNDERLQDFEGKYEDFIGPSLKRYEILILRDPYNLFASLIRSNMIEASKGNHEIYVDLYKSYAKQFIEQPATNGSLRRIYLNYNRWFLEPEYRIQIAQNLEFNDSGKPYKRVATMGRGSSFDGLKLDNQAQSMKVLERWKEFQDDIFWQTIFKDADLIELSNKIFGPILLGY